MNTLITWLARLGDKPGALGADAPGWLSHRQWRRRLAGMIGPAIVLLGLYPRFQCGWSNLDAVRRAGVDARRGDLGPGVAGTPPLRIGQL